MVEQILDRRSVSESRWKADDSPMDELDRIIDGDPASLAARVQRALDRGGAGCDVTRFTYWYTGRPPVYEAIVVRRPGAPPE